MALGTWAKQKEHGFSPTDASPIIRATFVGDASYPIGGYAEFSAFVAAQVARGVNVVSVHGFGDGGGAGYQLEYDSTNDKLKVRVGATSVEVADTTNLSGVTFSATIHCK